MSAAAATAHVDQRAERAGLVLASLIAVANLNLSVANVAIPEIGDDFDSSQTMLNPIAVGYSWGLAASVLWSGRSATAPQEAEAIIAAAESSFLEGDHWAYAAGLVAVLGGAALVFFLFPRHDRERQLLDEYHSQDLQGESAGA